MVSFEDFKKLDLRIGKIMSAEKVEGSEKLLRLSVSLGDETRQIVAGLGKSYLPDDLLGKEVVVVANLEPRELMGLESQGMLLATKSGEDIVILEPEKEVAPGSAVS